MPQKMPDIKDCCSQFNNKEFLQRQVPELSRLLVGKTKGQNIWSCDNTPKNWPIVLKWKNPTSCPKDTKEELKSKFDWLKAETKRQNLLSKKQKILFDVYDERNIEKVVTFIEKEKFLTGLKQIKEYFNEKLVSNIKEYWPNEAAEIATEWNTLSQNINMLSNRSFDVFSDQIEVRTSDSEILCNQDAINTTDAIITEHKHASLSNGTSTKCNSARLSDKLTKFQKNLQEIKKIKLVNNNLTSDKKCSERKRKYPSEFGNESLSEESITSKRSPQELSSNSPHSSCSQSPTESGIGSVDTLTDLVCENTEQEILDDPTLNLDNETLYDSNTVQPEISEDLSFNLDNEAPNDCRPTNTELPLDFEDIDELDTYCHSTDSESKSTFEEILEHP